MFKLDNTYNKFTSLALVMLILFPTLGKTVHSLSMDLPHTVHQSQDASIPAIQDKEADCLICDFQFVSFMANSRVILPTLPVEHHSYQCTGIASVCKATVRHFSLRGPPTLS